MALQTTHSTKATAQNASTPSREPPDDAQQGELDLRVEPRSCAAGSYLDASLAPSAAGEVAGYMDEGDALGDAGCSRRQPTTTARSVPKPAAGRDRRR